MNMVAPIMTVFPNWLEAELRSDHAGETGAVAIYDGILAVCKDKAIIAFARAHRQTEREHLRLISAVLPTERRSKLVQLWYIAGWITGALPACFGRNAVYATIDAVESFVDEHYQQQVDALNEQNIFPDIKAMVLRCQADEVHHRDEARKAFEPPKQLWLRTWIKIVDSGSRGAVALARKF